MSGKQCRPWSDAAFAASDHGLCCLLKLVFRVNTVFIFTDSGKSFGEIALISEDSVRNATVIADEETDLLVIHRDLFNRSMKVSYLKKKKK